MSSKPDIVALVPMRHYSERVRGKNYRLLAGKPLYAHILEALIACSEFKEIVVDTDSPIISEGVMVDFPSVRIIERPDHLREGDVPMNDVLLNDVNLVPSDFYFQTHSTNPLLRPETISLAISTFFEAYPQHDSLFSVTKIQTRMWDAACQPINHDPQVLLRTQDLPPIYEENSCLYVFERSNFIAKQNRLGANPMMFEIPVPEAWDIDNELDFLLVDFLMRFRAAPFPWEAE
jgi:CMP-N-acetylneuraminic acid synthetase